MNSREIIDTIGTVDFIKELDRSPPVRAGPMFKWKMIILKRGKNGVEKNLC